jgi:DNA repair photolyase
MQEESRKVLISFGGKAKEYEVIDNPIPHILVNSKKEIHGWWPGKRECTGERMLINPYNGCTHNCFFCYAHALWGYFFHFEKEHVVTVFRDFDKVVSEQLDKLDYASCGYLSPVTDPFQILNDKYRLTEKIISEFVKRNIPVEFITKGKISDEAIELISKQKHSFGQVSILTLDDNIRKKLVPGGVPVDTLLDNLRRLKEKGIFTVVRIDPIFPYITDNPEDLGMLVSTVKELGAKHIIVSCVDIPSKLKPKFLKGISLFGEEYVQKYNQLYTESIDGDLNANIGYRKKLFGFMREICNKHGVTMSLCMEYEKIDTNLPKGLNSEFMTSKNCEGIDVPIYKFSGEIKEGYRQFKPVDCSNDGNCLTCKDPICGIQELAMGRCYSCDSKCKVDFKLSDYKKWGKDKTTQRTLF